MRSDRRKQLAEQNGDHWAHHDPGVRQLIREAQAETWDRLCDWLDCHTESDVRGSVKVAARMTNPYRDRP